MSKEEFIAILDQTTPSASHGAFEPFKTSAIFDSTAVHPEWLGTIPKCEGDVVKITLRIGGGKVTAVDGVS